MSYEDWQVPAGFDASQGLLTAEEVADQYRVSIHTVLSWGRTGKMPAMRTPGREWRFSVAWVCADLAKEHDGQPAAP